jgi:hypothetical protein
MAVRKSLSQRGAYIVTESRGRIPINEETTLVYPVVELDQAGTGQFIPLRRAADAKLVSEFPSPLHAHVTLSTYLGRAVPHENQIS